jgi:hypothetical protein
MMGLHSALIAQKAGTLAIVTLMMCHVLPIIVAVMGYAQPAPVYITARKRVRSLSGPSISQAKLIF